MKIALIQLTSSDNYADNLVLVTAKVTSAAKDGAEFIVLPEYALLYGEKSAPSIEEQHRFVADMSALAKNNTIWLVAGSFPFTNPNAANPYSACLVFNSDGEEVARYNKIHLFDALVGTKKRVFRESDKYSHGSEVVIVETPWGKLGLAMCFDLRFAKLFKVFAEQECDFVVVPAAFTSRTGKDHWDLLVRARGLDTQAVVVACNQTGTHFNGGTSWGHSMIVGPWGDVRNTLGAEVGVLHAEIDFEPNADVRDSMPLKRIGALVEY